MSIINDEKVIDIRHISKVYKLYDNPKDRLLDALKLTRKQKYKEYRALDDISFCVHKGETVGLIGTNGAGKSTLLKIITGVLTQTSGEVEVHGKISALLELGAGFNGEYTGIENIYLNGQMMGYTREQMDERIQSIIDFAGIGDFINQPVKTYSSGMFARLAFAVAINVDPDILIVDEALSVGDIYFQAKCFKKMDEIKKKGTTVLLVTHDMSSVISYCDRAVILNKGHYVKEGNAKEMVDIYKKILVNQYDENETENGGEKKSAIAYLKESDGTDWIFTYTFKNVRGVDITGTNTMFERVDVELAKAGEVYEVTFAQKAMMQGGEYMMSFSCTGFENGEFVVHQRLYDITKVAIVSEQDTVGFFDLDSKVTVEKLQ